MTKRGNGTGRDPVIEELHAIRGALQDLMILECARTGMKREELRRIVPVDKTRISRIMKHARKARVSRGEA
jgi:hypothetical protein